MKLIVKMIVLSVFMLPLVLLGALLLAVDDTPKLQDRAELTPEQIARGKLVFEQNDPRRMMSGSLTKAILKQEDLDLAINYIANQYVGGVTRLNIDKGHVVIEGTLGLPSNPLGRFMNVKLELTQTDKLPRIDKMTIGKLSFPHVMVDWLINYSLVSVKPLTGGKAFIDMIRRVEFLHRQITVTYRWQDDLPAKLGNALMSTQGHKRIETYQRRLTELTKASESNLNLTELMRPLFQLAKDRTSNNGEAIEENRAAILVLALYVNQKQLNKIIPPSTTWPRPVWRKILLSGRDDFSKHYLVSAMLSAYSGTPLADAVGLYKEIEDSKGGSGFSFNDIAADRAGTRMGELAISNELRAKKIQQLMVTATESDIMPNIVDLPEFMPEIEFKRRFGGTQGKEYRQMMENIEQRVAALRINHD